MPQHLRHFASVGPCKKTASIQISIPYRCETFGTTLALVTGMKNTVTELSPRLFSHIVRMASSGRPLRAMLWLNEYLPPNDGLRIAVATKAKSSSYSAQIKEYYPELAAQIFSGARLNELSNDLVIQLNEVREHSMKKCRPVLLPREPRHTLRSKVSSLTRARACRKPHNNSVNY